MLSHGDNIGSKEAIDVEVESASKTLFSKLHRLIRKVIHGTMGFITFTQLMSCVHGSRNRLRITSLNVGILMLETKFEVSSLVE